MRRTDGKTREPSAGEAVGRRGSVLLGVLIVSMLSSLVVLSVLFSVRVEHSASGGSQRAQQAWAAALSGIERVVFLLQKYPFDPSRWGDNPEELHAQWIASDGAEDWYFTVYAPGGPDGEWRFGAMDEGARFNVKSLDAEFLQTLPGVTPEIAAALLDYMDGDSAVTPDGAEQDHYSRQGFPHVIANAAPASLEELILVRGLDGSRLYGEDANRNLRLDPEEDDGDETSPPDDGDGELTVGLSTYLTVWSNHLEIDARGEPKVLFDGSPEQVSVLGLPEELATFFACSQNEGTTFTHPAELIEQVCVGKAPGDEESGNDESVELESGVGPAELSVLLDKTKFVDSETLTTPHVNVLTASMEVLALVPGIDAATAESIVRRREELDPEERLTTAWLLGSEVVDVETYRKIAPWLVPRSFQFRVRVIGYGIRSGVYRILEAVIDMGGAQPQILYLRDLTRLGPSFPIPEAGEELG